VTPLVRFCFASDFLAERKQFRCENLHKITPAKHTDKKKKNVEETDLKPLGSFQAFKVRVKLVGVL